ncbi:uncharacterized protein LOC114320724 [Camellia sinensis]|uniref:uncharacterized protein LOC114320724 n=1 Tax=Camellia sinensis TaxID=4442 RepID=UPI001036570E|nr:uncharacterized protein LOC114320724 [Camellia sinensis]
MWARDKTDFMVKDPTGLSGGLLCIRDTEVFQLQVCCSSRRFILLSVGNRKKLWDSLIKLKMDFHNPCWRKEVFGNVIFKLKTADEELHTLDLVAESRDLVYNEILRRRLVREQVWKLSRMEEWIWLQKSRLNWNMKGDRNTRFFHLMVEFSEEEIKAVIRDCNGNKAPSPDGFNMICFQKLWKLMKRDVCNFFKEFHMNGKLLKRLNSSFISLIPKKDNPVGHGDYRPISLIGSMYKILAKVLASRLKPVLPHIISESQSAFIGGKNILNGVLITNEVIDGWKKAKKKGVLIKLDFDKIEECVSFASLSVLVNGFPIEEFSPQRGLKQEDPLSPFLFNLATEGFSILLSTSQQLGLIKGVKIGANGVLLSHLQFANGSLLFCEAEEVEYLGLSLGANPNREASWKLVLDKVRSRLTGWKRRLLSFAGRLTLIKVVTSSLPVYYLSLFKIPVGVAREFEKLQARFLWGVSELKRKLHMVKWEDITKSVEQGGLGIRRVRVVNDCLLVKWW